LLLEILKNIMLFIWKLSFSMIIWSDEENCQNGDDLSNKSEDSLLFILLIKLYGTKIVIHINHFWTYLFHLWFIWHLIWPNIGTLNVVGTKSHFCTTQQQLNIVCVCVCVWEAIVRVLSYLVMRWIIYKVL
jgi:hypothetical protein